MNGTPTLRNGYDAFISHNRADKPFARALADRLAGTDYAGRPLRPWLDEQVLDPGSLSGEAELTSALDRSRRLVLVLSPASVGSKWVEFELAYFLKARPPGDVVPLLKAPCTLPGLLGDAQPIDFTVEGGGDRAFAELHARLCPPGGSGLADVERDIDAAWANALGVDPGGMDAEPSPERDALLTALLRHPIDDAATEGPALVGFMHAARRLVHEHAEDHPTAYNMQMLLGDCLGAAVHRHPRYRQLAHRFLDLQPATGADPVLAFVVARAASKLAEIDPALIDGGVLLRVARQLDAVPPLNNRKAVVARQLGRMAAKLRGSDAGDLLIQVLSEGGAAARMAAIGGITMCEDRSPPAFYLSELEALHAARPPRTSAAGARPSRKLLARLFAIELDQPPVVAEMLRNGVEDLKRDFGVKDLPYGYSWFQLRRAAAPASAHLAPFMGTVAMATLANMEELALRVDAAHVVCLTQPRIVDALFERACALLVAAQEADSPQCRRLAGRGVPFATLEPDRLAALSDGDTVEVEADLIRVVSAR
jgi:hypothetical protein